MLLSALVLGGCGGDDESTEPAPGLGTAAEGNGGAGTEGGQATTDGDSGPSDEELVEVAIDAVLSSSRPAKVCGGVTDEFLRRAYGDRAGCAAAIDLAAQAKVVMVRRLEIDGDAAAAVVRLEGGIYDGGRLDVALVRESDGWKVDRLDADVPVGP